jgi:hypothetical protein
VAISVRWFKPGPKVYWRNRWFDKAMVTAYLDKEKAQGYKEYFYQGSYNRGVAASAGTHNGGAVSDTQSRGLTSRKRAASRGIVGWPRTRRQGFMVHDHNMLMWATTAPWGLKAQMYAYRNGRNGLASNGRDDSGTRGSYRHFLDWQKAKKAADAKNNKPKVTPNASLAAIEYSRKYGDKARSYTSVKLMQNALNKIYTGTPLKADGILGPKTLALFNKWRKANFGADAAKGSIGAVSIKLLFKRANMKVNVWNMDKAKGGKIL